MLTNDGRLSSKVMLQQVVVNTEVLLPVSCTEFVACHMVFGGYGDSVDNTAAGNSSVFSLIRIRWLPSARACGQ